MCFYFKQFNTVLIFFTNHSNVFWQILILFICHKTPTSWFVKLHLFLHENSGKHWRIWKFNHRKPPSWCPSGIGVPKQKDLLDQDLAAQICEGEKLTGKQRARNYRQNTISLNKQPLLNWDANSLSAISQSPNQAKYHNGELE